MLRHFITAFAALLTAAAAMAVPAKRGTFTATQPDGSTVTLIRQGDERGHSLIDASTDQPVSRGSDGYFRVCRRHASRSPRRSAAMKSQVAHTGSPRVPVILVQYKDYKFKDADPAATFKSFFQSGTKSARQYFIDQSGGKYTPQFDVYGPVTLAGNRADYGGNDDYYGEDVGVGNMVGQACQKIDPSLDFSLYDNDGDGECDVVIVIYAGDGEASSYDDDCEDAVWPCQWELSDSEFGRALSLDRTRVDKFAVFNELYGDLSKIDGIGCFCHEFSHCLGLPDFYDTEYGPHFGMAHWSLMDYGSYLDDGYTPIGYSAYEKEFMGWMTIPEGGANMKCTLSPLNVQGAGCGDAVKLTNTKDANEYYIIENRARKGWDKYLPAEGLLITHVTYSESAWDDNTVNNYDLQRMTPVPADNSLKLDSERYYGETYYTANEADLKGDLWPYGSADALTDTSKPAAKVNTGSYLSKPVTEMTRNADGTISFWVMKGADPDPRPGVGGMVSAPANINWTATSATSLRVTWLAGDDEDVTYSLEVREDSGISINPPASETVLLSTDFTTDSHGWDTGGYVATEPDVEATRLGSAKQLGSVTSPLFNTSGGTLAVGFNGCYYSEDGSSVKVSLLDDCDVAMDSRTVALTDRFDDYEVTFASDLPTARIRIETIEKKKRAYLRGAAIAGTAAADSRAGEGVRTFTDIDGLHYEITGITPGAVAEFRLQAVPNDKTLFTASDWTPWVRVDMSDFAGINETEANAAGIEYFNLQGMRVAAPLPGQIVIERRGTAVTKRAF